MRHHPLARVSIFARAFRLSRRTARALTWRSTPRRFPAASAAAAWTRSARRRRAACARSPAMSRLTAPRLGRPCSRAPPRRRPRRCRMRLPPACPRLTHGCASRAQAQRCDPCVTAPAAQVHGPVSREPAEWTAVSVEEGQLTEVLYEKAKGEGIAKARRGAAAALAPTSHPPHARRRSPSTARSVATPSRHAQARCLLMPSRRARLAPTPLLVCAVKELSWCFRDARDDSRVGIVILTGA